MTDERSAEELIEKYGSAVDAVLAVEIGALTVGAAMKLFALMAKEIARKAKGEPEDPPSDPSKP